MSTANNRKRLDEMRNVLRLPPYSIRTERTYCEWIRKFVHFHKMKSRDDLAEGEKKIEAVLTHLAVHEKVAPSTQNQAVNALVFLYRKVLKQNLSEAISAVRANKKMNMPVVLTREGTARILSLMTGTPQWVAKLLYGSGLRISEAIRLRVQHIDFPMKTLTVRSEKGNKDRVTTFPATVIPFLNDHLVKVKTIHQKDLEQGYGSVYLAHALARKYKNAAKTWGWQFVFPSSTQSTDPLSNAVRRHLWISA